MLEAFKKVDVNVENQRHQERRHRYGNKQFGKSYAGD
jgi:hypothetical protein